MNPDEYSAMIAPKKEMREYTAFDIVSAIKYGMEDIAISLKNRE